jgi:hypothetical protein
MAMSKFTKQNATMYASMRENPPIPFTPKSKKVKSELTEAEKTELITFDFFVDPENSATKYSKEFLIFKDGDPEDQVVNWISRLGNDDAFEGTSRQVQDASNLVERKGSFPV